MSAKKVLVNSDFERVFDYRMLFYDMHTTPSVPSKIMKELVAEAQRKLEDPAVQRSVKLKERCELIASGKLPEPWVVS